MMGESKDNLIRKEIADEEDLEQNLAIQDDQCPLCGGSFSATGEKPQSVDPSSVYYYCQKCASEKYDPDHWNPMEGGNRVGDDYW